MAVAVAGIGVGLVRRAGSRQAMATLLFGVEARDPATFAGVAAALAMVAGAGVLSAGRRASRVDPIVALREE